MGSVPMYNLTWGEYGTSLISAVQLLRYHGELVDVTLAAGGRTFHAHKVVLCAASPFLLDLLKSTTCKHPVVMLAGVQAADLEALLEFVYRGEVSIDQNQLPSLLQAAHCLNIQGLAPSPTPHSIQNEHQQQQQQQHTIKHKSEIVERDLEGLQSDEDVGNPKKRKKIKRSKSPPLLQTESVHEEKVYLQSNSNNSNEGSVVQETSSNVNVPMWTQQMNIVNVASSTTVDALPSPVQGMTIPISGNNGNSSTQLSSSIHVGNTKTKGASEQPGACPLCGAMLRQARNLRRHLVTSCKYRMYGGVPAQTSTTSIVHFGRELTPLQNIPMQNVERTPHNSTEQQIQESKPEELTPVSCTAQLISSNPSIISDTATNIN